MADTKVPVGAGAPPGSPPEPVAPRAAVRRQRTGGLANVARSVRHNRKALAGLVMLGVFLVMSAFPAWLAPYDPRSEAFLPSDGPSRAHWLGTTSYGQDILSQTIYGARLSIVIAFVVGLVSTLITVVVGVSAAYIGGLTDGVLSLVTDVFLVIPTFPLIIVIAAMARNTSDWILIGVLVITGWSYGARQLRSQALTLRRRDFLESAKVRGERRSYIITVEILPTMTSLIVANFLGAALYAVVTAAGLQFVGLGDPNALSWGTMLYWAYNNSALYTGQYLWAIVPGLCIALLGAALALLNYAFDEIGNPALRPVRRSRARRARA